MNSRILAISALLVSSAALAQSESGPQSQPTVDEKAQVRLRYAVTIRNATEQGVGGRISYDGFSPSELGFHAWLWLLAGDHIGLTLGAQRESFSLKDKTTGATITSGGLAKAQIGPTGRIRFGPARIEAAASYLFQQLPLFGTVGTPVFATAQRHGILLAARALVDLGPVTIEGRFEYPLVLAASSGATNLNSNGLGAGGALRVQLFRTGPLMWGLLGEFQWHQDGLSALSNAPAMTMSQNVMSAGGAVDVKWKEEDGATGPTTGIVRVSVRDVNGPVSGASIKLTHGGATETVTGGTDGSVTKETVTPGELTAKVSAPGYVDGEVKSSVSAGETRTLEVLLEKEKPKVGDLLIRVVSLDGPAIRAVIEMNGEQKTTDSGGTLSFSSLSPGPVMLKVTAPGFNPASEAASIVAGRTSEMKITLVPEKKRVPATLSGHVRSAKGGAPVDALLEIAPANSSLNSTGGAFSVQLPGGRYTIRISAPGYVTQTKTVTVKDGDQAIFNVDLSPKK